MKRWFVNILLLCFWGQLKAQQIEHTWLNQDKNAKISIYLAKDGKWYGKIIWLKEPLANNGKPATDIENPDEKLKTQPVLNLIILKGFTKAKNENYYEGGTVYDPKNGKTYCGKLTPTGNTLILRGFICGLSWLGRSSVWTLAE